MLVLQLATKAAATQSANQEHSDTQRYTETVQQDTRDTKS